MESVRLAWLTGLVAVLVATSAHSQHRESGDVYLGATLGYHKMPDAEEDLQRELDANRGFLNPSVSVDDGVVGWGLYGGYAVTDGLALEVGYFGNQDMEMSLRGELQGTTVLPIVADADISSSAFHASVVAGIPMPSGSAVYPFVRAGVIRWETKASLRIEGLPFPVEDDGLVQEEDGTDPLFGVGFDVPGFGTGTFRCEYVLFWIGDDDGGRHHRFQAGVNFTF